MAWGTYINEMYPNAQGFGAEWLSHAMTQVEETISSLQRAGHNAVDMVLFVGAVSDINQPISRNPTPVISFWVRSSGTETLMEQYLAGVLV